jgi:predicted Fe-Mo cluster-binding NifX family protein
MQENTIMKVCIPTLNGAGQLSEVCDHFGSAPYFTIYDLQTDEYETVNNSEHNHEHGTCHPMDSLKDKGIEAVICRGLGRRALQKLNQSGVKVFRTERSTVSDVIEDFSKGRQEEIGPESACQQHRCH